MKAPDQMNRQIKRDSEAPPNYTKRQTINCDQVAWLLDIFGRYLPKDNFPAVSQQREMMKYGMLYEVMDIANLEFENASAQWNGTPNAARYNATTREK